MENYNTVPGGSLKELLINPLNMPMSAAKMLWYFSESLEIPPSHGGPLGTLNKPMETLAVPQRFCSLQYCL